MQVRRKRSGMSWAITQIHLHHLRQTLYMALSQDGLSSYVPLGMVRLVHLLTCPTTSTCLRTPPGHQPHLWLANQPLGLGKWTTTCVQQWQLRFLCLEDTNKNSLWAFSSFTIRHNVICGIFTLYLSDWEIPSTLICWTFFHMKGCWNFKMIFLHLLKMNLCWLLPYILYSIVIITLIDFHVNLNNGLCSWDQITFGHTVRMCKPLLLDLVCYNALIEDFCNWIHKEYWSVGFFPDDIFGFEYQGNMTSWNELLNW